MRLSVALCTHNGERYLEAQLRSILDGSRVPDELVLSDDASADGTLTVARRVLDGAALDVVVLENPVPLGVTANFEQALRACTGDVVLLSDQDDVWSPDRAARVEAEFAASDILLRHSDARLVDADGDPLAATLFGRLRVRPSERRAIAAGRSFETYLRRNLATGATAAVRRELVEDAQPFPAEWVHDEWLAVVASARGRIRLAETVDVDYRQHGANQIGVAEPTLRYRVSRVLGDSPDRAAVLAVRTRLLADRLETLGLDGPAASARSKARFEERRARLPARRVLRVPHVLRGLVSGDYRRFASQRSFDAVRDLFRGA